MTALPPSSDFTTTGITKGAFKTALTSLRSYLSGLLGDAGTQAAALSGLGVPLNGTLSKTAAYTVVAADRGKLIDCTTGTWTLALDAAATLGAGFVFGFRNSGSGTITINPNLSEQIDGGATVVLAPRDSCLVECTGTEWKTVGRTPYTSGANITITDNVIAAESLWALVSTVNVSAVAAIDFDLQEDIYCEWKFVLDGIIPAVNSERILMRVGHTGGTVFVSGANHYAWSLTEHSTNSTGANDSASTDTSVPVIARDATNGIGTAAGQHGHAVVTIGGIGSALAAAFSYESRFSLIDSSGYPHGGIVRGMGNDLLTPRLFDAVRFFPGSGNFEAAGTIKMYALKRAG